MSIKMLLESYTHNNLLLIYKHQLPLPCVSIFCVFLDTLSEIVEWMISIFSKNDSFHAMTNFLPLYMCSKCIARQMERRRKTTQVIYFNQNLILKNHPVLLPRQSDMCLILAD